MPGILVALEGVDGSGTTTVAMRVVDELRARGFRAVYTREPGDSPAGRLARELLSRGGWWPEPLALLFASDRVAHLYYEVVAGKSGVIGAMLDGYIVVTDRYKYSSAAYQSSLSTDSVLTARSILRVVNALAPPAHILVYLRVDPETAHKRVERRGGERSVYENPETLRRLTRAYDVLVQLLRMQPEYTPPPADEPWAMAIRLRYRVDPRSLYPLPAPEIVELDASEEPSRLASRIAEAVENYMSRMKG